MNSTKGNNYIMRVITFPLFALMLVLSMVMPSMAFAEEGKEISVSISPESITEEEINTMGEDEDIEITLTLQDKKWAYDVLEKESILISNMEAVVDSERWEEYRKEIKIKKNENGDIATNPDRKTLTLLLPQANADQFFLTNNQTITINISPVLIEEWPGTVKSVKFTINAKPRISIGGMNGTTIEEIKKGEKEIELTLLNATWNESNFKTITNLNEFLQSFKSNGNQWDVAEFLENTDPNKVLTFSDDLRTLRFDLPAVSAAEHTGEIKVDGIDKKFYTVVDENYGDLINLSQLTFKIINQGPPSLTVTPSIKEEEIKNSGKTIVLTLLNAEWTELTDAKRLALIDAIVAKDQSEQWGKVQKVLKENPGTYVNVTDTPTNTKVEVKIPKTTGYSLTKDQTISIKVPYQLLENDVKLGEQKFTINAQPKALISGSATPAISQTDFAKGGKTIIVTLVNAAFESDVVTNTTKREQLLDAFGWPIGNVENTIKARADVKLSKNNTVATITLPSISEKVTESISILFENGIGASGKELLQDNSNFDVAGSGLDPVITIDPVKDQTATISGTIRSNTNEFDIVKGNETVIITLKNDSWVKNVDGEKIRIKLKDKNGDQTLDIKEFKSTSDQSITLTLKPFSDFELSEDTSAIITIPSAQLAVRGTDLIVDSAFTVAAVKAELSGTGTSMDAADVQKGGKTIIVTLKNAEFDTTEQINMSSILKAQPGKILPWNNIEDIKLTKSSMTIKLPPVPSYQSANEEKITVTVPKALIIDAPEDKIAGTISIGAVAKASINTTTFAEADIIKGGKAITITLEEANWDPTIETNKSKKSGLLKGFTVTDQTKEWKLITSAAAQGDFKVDGKKLTITLPAVQDYSIIRDQIVSITIPKSVLSDYKYDIPIENQKLTIKVPDVSTDKSFAEVLEEGLSEFIGEDELDTIRVTVPEKKVISIKTSMTELSGQSIATIEVITNQEVKKVQATIMSEDEDMEAEREGNGTFIFVFDNVKPDSVLKISVFGENDAELDQSDIYKKIAKGNKTYTEVPKNPLEGTYSLYSLLTEKSLLTNILKYYTLDELKIGK